MVRENVSRLLCNGVGAQLEIDETSAGDGGRFREIGDVEMLQDFLSNASRTFAALFSKHQRCICLVIAKARISRLRQLAGIREAGFGRRIGQLFGENYLECLHR